MSESTKNEQGVIKIESELESEQRLILLEGKEVDRLTGDLGKIDQTEEDSKYQSRSVMRNVLRVSKQLDYSVVIYLDEHAPPHFAIKWGDCFQRFKIKDCSELEHKGPRLSGTKLKTVKKFHKDHKNYLIEEWNRMRPSDCPVGPYRE